MASSIDEKYKAIEAKKVSNKYTQRIQCVKCLRVVAYLNIDQYFRGPAICVDCLPQPSENLEPLIGEISPKALGEKADE